eukprot:228520-Lingulodinium_polyedra.AAC.1
MRSKEPHNILDAPEDRQDPLFVLRRARPAQPHALVRLPHCIQGSVKNSTPQRRELDGRSKNGGVQNAAP